MSSQARQQADTAYRINPRDPLPEEETPRIDACLANHTVWCVPHNSPEPEERSVLVKRDRPQQAYQALPSMGSTDLNHHAPDWGHVSFAKILPKIAEGVFQEESPATTVLVAVKQLNKRVIQEHLASGHLEDPYKEIQRMQSIGDNVHVLGCVEALEDETFLYVITPFCEQGSLVDFIPWDDGGLTETEARKIFRQILESLQYLRSHGICHRDISPDNFLIYNDRAVLTDLAMSFRVSPETNFVTPRGRYGKPAFLPPEVLFNAVFDAYSCDLWSAVIILFNLLTGEILYRLPHPDDPAFRYFILAGGFSATPTNERITDVLTSLAGADHNAIWRIASQCLALSPSAVEVLEKVLRMANHERWTFEHVASSDFVTN